MAPLNMLRTTPESIWLLGTPNRQPSMREHIVVENTNIAVLFRQIAGAVARRIVMYSKVDDTAIKGQDFGFIKFSQGLTYFFPVGTDIHVQIDQIVKGNKTIIASY